MNIYCRYSSLTFANFLCLLMKLSISCPNSLELKYLDIFCWKVFNGRVTTLSYNIYPFLERSVINGICFTELDTNRVPILR
ncbi:hypothetical protein pCPXV0145 [Cowpox virus]|uniref:Uncharacterized protein n=1 Tax=Cowpox virus TaxID=10243 RepID=A0A212QF07_COWPX|nr:hypothetical protein pCPXV0145 [Cowpox virus]